MKWAKDFENCGVSMGRDAGFFSAWIGLSALHLFVRTEFRFWGIRNNWHDGPLRDIGAGPLFLLVYRPKYWV